MVIKKFIFYLISLFFVFNFLNSCVKDNYADNIDVGNKKKEGFAIYTLGNNFTHFAKYSKKVSLPINPVINENDLNKYIIAKPFHILKLTERCWKKLFR